MCVQDWIERVAALWRECDALEAEVFVARMEALVAERPENDALARYELGGAYDSTGQEREAAREYERAFASGLPAELIRPATIQYASTLRNLGRAHEAVVLLEAERARTSDTLDDAVTIFLAFALVDEDDAERAVGEIAAALDSRFLVGQRAYSWIQPRRWVHAF